MKATFVAGVVAATASAQWGGNWGVPDYKIPEYKDFKIPEPKVEPIEVAYHASYAVRKPTFATCELAQGDIEMLQLPGGAIKAKAELTGLSAGASLELRIAEYGLLTDACANIGDEFNPYKTTCPEQIKYGGWATSEAADDCDAEDGRGEFDAITADADGNADFLQEKLLQNLEGKTNIMGRSIGLFEVDSDVAISCCTIARDQYWPDEEEIAEMEHVVESADPVEE